MSYARFASKTKIKYSRGLNYVSPSQLPQLKFRLFSNPLILNRIENEINNENNIVPIPPTPTFNNKMVGIFTPSTVLSDQLTIDSIKYYWSVVPQFEPFLIIEYDGTQTDLIRALDEAYNLGKRYIFSFSTSSSLANSLDWFNAHPDAQGVSRSAASGILAIPKKIYRTIPDTMIAFETIQFNIFDGVPGNGAIYYIYNSTQLISNSFKTELLNYCAQYSVQLVEYSYNSLSDVTYSNVQNTIQQIYDDMVTNLYTKSSICLSMVDFSEEFFSLFNSGMADVSSLGGLYFDLNLTSLTIIPSSPAATKTYFNNILYGSFSDGLMISNLAFNTPDNKRGALGSLNILYQLNNYGGYVNQLGTYNISYILDPVTRDNVANPTIFLTQYQETTNSFKDKSIIYEDIDKTLFECILTS